jgi:pullulanase
MSGVNRFFQAYLDDISTITILLPFDYFGGHSSTFTLKQDHQTVPLSIEQIHHLHDAIKYVCKCPITPSFWKTVYVMDERGIKTDLQIGAVIRTAIFDEMFYYDGDDLGANYHPEETTFKVWAPTATEATLIIKKDVFSEEELVPMTRKERGVWQAIVSGDVETYLYQYEVCVNQVRNRVVDPYAKSVSLNSEWGYVVDMKKTKRPVVSLPPLSSPLDSIIYEMHVRDFTKHPNSGILKKGKYLGVIEKDRQGKGGSKTGLDYLKELGVTHVELLPVNDFAGVSDDQPDKQYNWGYNPLFFNCPEGSYATNPSHPYNRIVELKEMIHTLQQEGIRIILDVVYNHVYLREESSFEKLVPGYYFRHDAYGHPANGTGVGNDFASERLMARKFILDSVSYWLNEYHVNGFRFDLMGILDVETMQEIRKLADQYDSSILLIGEGWDLPTPLPPEQKASMNNHEKLPGIGFFNDRFRDVVKGSSFDLNHRGVALGNTSSLDDAIEVFTGSVGYKQNGLFSSPTQTVNYVECHDNHTLWDKLIHIFSENDKWLEQRHRLATSFVLLAQGIPFLHSGQEFFRTKYGDGNSYKSPDEVNWLDWDRMEQKKENVEYVKGLIRLRKSHGAFRLSTKELIQYHLDVEAIDGTLTAYFKQVGAYGKWEYLYLIIHPLEWEREFVLPNQRKWYLISDGTTFFSTPVPWTKEVYQVPPVRCVIFGGNK